MERASMEAFYRDYAQVLNDAANRPTSESIDRLDEFYSPDFVAHVLIPPSHGGRVALDRDEWKGSMLQELSSVKETMQTNQLVIDPDAGKMAAQQSLDLSDQQTGGTIASLEAIAIYSLEQVDGSLRIVGLELMISDPGAHSFSPSE